MGGNGYENRYNIKGTSNTHEQNVIREQILLADGGTKMWALLLTTEICLIPCSCRPWINSPTISLNNDPIFIGFDKKPLMKGLY
jgi:hypothetical protein